MKFIKISLYLVFGFVLLAIVAAVVFVVTFDVNDYKTQITTQVKKHTGRELMVGNIKPSIFPWLGFELQQLSLSNAEHFNSTPMLQIARMDLRLEIIPLLKQNFNIDTVRIHGLHLNLQKDEVGKTNWDDIIEKQKSETVSDAKDNAVDKKFDETEQAASGKPFMFKANGIEIADAKIHWDDAQAKQKINVSDLSVTSGVIQLGEPVPVQISALIQTENPAMSIQLDTAVKINFELDAQLLALDDLSLSLNAKLAELDVDSLLLNVNTGVKAELKKQTFSLPKLSLEIDARGKAIPGGEIKAQVTSGVELDVLAQLLQFKSLKIQVLDITANSELQVTQLIDAPMVQGRIDVEAFNLKTLLSQLDVVVPEMQSDKALHSVSLGVELSAGQKAATLNSLKLKIDDTTVTGFLSVSEFKQPKIQYKLALDKINLDAYLPPAEIVPAIPAGMPGPGSTPVSAIAEDTPIDLPIELLRSLQVEGVLNAGVVNGFEQTIEQLMLEVSAADGLIKVPALSAQLLEGSAAMSAQLDVRKNTPQYQLKLKARSIKADSFVNPLLQELLGESSISISGASNLDASLLSAGQSVNQLMANSNGDVLFYADNVVLQGVDAEFFVRKAVTGYLLEKNIPVKEEWKGQYAPKETTAIKTLRASAVVKQGVVQNDDLLLDSARFKVTGSGSVNLSKETLNYRTVVDVQPLSTKTVAEKMLDIPLVIKAAGNFASPVIEVESSAWTKQVSRLLTSKAREDVQQKIEAVKEEQKIIVEEKKVELEQKKDEKVDELKNKLRDKYKDKLQGLF